MKNIAQLIDFSEQECAFGIQNDYLMCITKDFDVPISCQKSVLERADLLQDIQFQKICSENHIRIDKPFDIQGVSLTVHLTLSETEYDNPELTVIAAFALYSEKNDSVQSYWCESRLALADEEKSMLMDCLNEEVQQKGYTDVYDYMISQAFAEQEYAVSRCQQNYEHDI